MPRKDPIAAKEYWDAYRRTDRCKERQRRWRDRQRAWRQTPEGREEYYGRNIRSLYGIGLDDYKRIYAAQSGCCAICGKHESTLSKRLGIDHDHKTGIVRGLLCLDCNHAIGKFADDPALLQKAITYLLRQPGGSKSQENHGEKVCI